MLEPFAEASGPGRLSTAIVNTVEKWFWYYRDLRSRVMIVSMKQDYGDLYELDGCDLYEVKRFMLLWSKVTLISVEDGACLCPCSLV